MRTHVHANTKGLRTMTDTGAHLPHTATARGRTQSYSKATDSATTGWTGWVAFASIMMILLGIFQAIQGLVALFNDQYYVVGANGLIVSLDYTTWGWVHLILGGILVLAGIGVMAGNLVAQIAGIAIAGISAIVNLAFLAAYPLWGVIVITIDIIVIYALAVHGREMRST
jgi:hypothetical protein